MIIQNTIKCNKCNEQITSKHVHDYVTCSCGNCSCDGGREYLKRTGDDYTELSIIGVQAKDIWEMRNLLKLALDALNQIPNQKLAEGNTYAIASVIGKFLKDDRS